MNAIKKLIAVITMTATLAMILPLTSCSLQNNADFTQEITAGNIRVTIRDDMTEQEKIKNSESYITGFRWDGYGMNVGSIDARTVTLRTYNGKTGDEFLKSIAEKGKNATEIKKFGDISYIECVRTSGETDFLYTVYIMKEGYEDYFFEFHTKAKNNDKYREEYEKIISSVKILEEPQATIDVNIHGVIFELDGDAYELSSSSYQCGRYLLQVTNSNIRADKMTPEEFAEKFRVSDTINNAGELKTTPGGIPYFETSSDESYSTYYVMDIDNSIYYVIFHTKIPDDDALKADLNEIIDKSHTA